MDDERPDYAAWYIGPSLDASPQPIPPITPKPSLWQRLKGARMDLQSLKAADLALTPRAEVLARLGLGSAKATETCRRLDQEMDRLADKRRPRWSTYDSGDQIYKSRIHCALELAAEGLQQIKGGAAMMPGQWIPLVEDAIRYVQELRRRDLWDVVPSEHVRNQGRI